MNCPYCETLFEEKPQLQEFINAFGDTLFECPECKVVFELRETEAYLR